MYIIKGRNPGNTLDVELGQLIALFCPLGREIAVFNVSQLHIRSALLLFLSLIHIYERRLGCIPGLGGHHGLPDPLSAEAEAC